VTNQKPPAEHLADLIQQRLLLDGVPREFATLRAVGDGLRGLLGPKLAEIERQVQQAQAQMLVNIAGALLDDAGKLTNGQVQFTIQVRDLVAEAANKALAEQNGRNRCQ
jgi:hypothetical protein